MALNIRHPEADRLARALARTTGESITDAVLIAIRERLQRETGRGEDAEAVRQEIRRIQRHFASGRVSNPPSADEIIGYDEHGLPT
ncbi:MAG: type II toxin-antitoxin system VapB family antitoxin [Longimicrobiaceae bacterium]